MPLKDVYRKIALALLLLPLGGCGPFYGIFIDPLIPKPKIPPEHQFGEKMVLIWVDDAGASDYNLILRRELTRQIRRELLTNKAIRNVIVYENISHFRRRHPDLTQLSIQQLGKKMEAEEVLYVWINKFRLQHEAGESYYDTSISGYCKVIDCDSGKRIWPANQTYKTFNAKGEFTTGGGAEFETKQIYQLCQQTAQKIAPYFYEHRKGR